MPKRRRRYRVPTPVWERDRVALGRIRLGGRSPQFYATLGVIALVVAAIGLLGYGFGSDWIEDRNRPGSTAVRVDDTKYTVRYFTERLRIRIQELGGAGSQFAQSPELAVGLLSEELIEEGLLLRFAGEQAQTATDDEVKAEIATKLSITADDPNFDTRFQEELTRTNITEQQYRDMARATVLRKKVQEKFTAEVPATAEAIHYRQIIVAEQEEADAIKAQIEGGADFAKIAGEKSQDTTAKENGGDAGWAPRGFLESALEEVLFALEPNQLTVYATETNFYVYQVLEKQADRPVEEAQKSTISNNAYQKWLDDKRASVEVVNHMDLQDGDFDKINYAVSRVRQSA